MALQAGVTIVLLALFFAAYVASLHATISLSEKTGRTAVNERDVWYLVIHGVVLIVGSVTGALAGKWFSGLGLAFAVLFFVVLATGMVGIQLGSFAAACHGHNDIVRHWVCK